jgi:capsular polysaccharide transport system ATP-binding protein
MTIEFRNVSKKVRLGPVRLTYRDLNLRIEQDAHVAFLGHKEAGLPAIVDLICGADACDKGTITRTHSISWPIPSSQFLKKHLPIAANARFVARLYEVNEDEFVSRVAKMAEAEEFLGTRGDMCPKDVLARFFFSLGMCLDFDQLILTNAAIGGKADRTRMGEILSEKITQTGLLLVTSDIKSAQQFCDQAYVFDEGRATFFDDMDAAAEFFGSIATKGGEEEDFFDSDPELENLVNVDF